MIGFGCNGEHYPCRRVRRLQRTLPGLLRASDSQIAGGIMKGRGEVATDRPILQRLAQWLNPRGWPRAVQWLTTIMFVVYLLEFAVFHTLGQGWYLALFLFHKDLWLLFWTLITAPLSHDVHDPLHATNIVFFVPIGLLVSRYLRDRGIVALFFVSGTVSTIVQVQTVGNPANGASGAVLAFLGAFTAFYLLDEQRRTAPGIVLLPSAVLAFVVVSALGIMRISWVPTEGIGHVAHLVGIVVGLTWGTITALTRRHTGRAATSPSER